MIRDADSSLPNTKRQLRTTINNTLSAAAVERKLAILQTNCADLEKKVRERDQKLDLLEKDRRWLYDREQEEREAREREGKEARKREAELKHDRDVARGLLAELEVAHAELGDAHDKLKRKHQHEADLLKTQLEESQKQAMFLEARVEEEKNAAKEVASKLASELSTSTSSLSQSTSSAPDTDHRLLTAELKRQATYLRQLESTNTRLNADVIVLKNDNTVLRERNSVVEVLREEKRGLESRLKMKEVEVEKLVRKVEEVRRDRRTSSSRRSSIASLPLNPSTLSTHLETSELASLRLAHAALMEQHGSTLAELAALKQEKDALLEAANSNRSLAALGESPNITIQLRLKDGELQATLKELAFLEAAVTRLTSDPNISSHDDTNSLAEAQMKQYQTLLSDAKRSNSELRSEIETLLAKLKQMLFELSVHLHATALDAVEQELFDLRGEVAGGRHIPPNTRVLEMAHNPHAEWEASRTAVLERLKGENQALLKRLTEVEAALKEADVAKTQSPGTQSHLNEDPSALVPKESLDLAIKEKEELENTLVQKEKRLLRLQQVFKAKSGEFREAIESIMGVKLAFYPNGQVRVTSLFDLNASFVFGPDKSAKQNQTEPGRMNMQLVATGEGGPQDLPDMMRYWIETEGCLPGFLASVTLECYESSKRKHS
ncbi:mitotic checkpoint protein-domain-containing protein [Lentinula raphanica]|nr:mitotic checkpoint protein-domain-containing protein [Lentinula raphanica]